MRREESNLQKRAKIDALKMTDDEWTRIKYLIELLEVRCNHLFSVLSLIIYGNSCLIWPSRLFHRMGHQYFIPAFLL